MDVNSRRGYGNGGMSSTFRNINNSRSNIRDARSRDTPATVGKQATESDSVDSSKSSETFKNKEATKKQ
jgi:hypothetical protein